MGKLRAMHACASLCRSGHSQHIFLIGFAGGLTTGLKVGDVIEPRLFIEQDYFAEPFEKFPNRVRSNARPLIARSIVCTMLTQDRFLTENPYKNKKSVDLIACDMESYAVAYFCSKEKIPYSVIKLISDSADENADHDFLKACKKLSPKLNRTVLEAIKKIR